MLGFEITLLDTTPEVGVGNWNSSVVVAVGEDVRDASVKLGIGIIDELTSVGSGNGSTFSVVEETEAENGVVVVGTVDDGSGNGSSTVVVEEAVAEVEIGAVELS